MPHNQDELEPINPRTARDLYLDHKSTNCTEATVRNHRYAIKYFIIWCDQEDITNLNKLTGRDLNQFKLWRTEDKDLAPMTVRNQMSALRVFLKWAASIEAVPPELYDKVLVPRVRAKNQRRDEMLGSETAQEILDYLSTYHYASLQHVVLALLWETGMRLGALVSLDVDDVDLDEKTLRLLHRPEQGTTLKNGKSGERLVAIRSSLSALIAEYIAHNRNDVTDENGRRPLLTTPNTRRQRSSLRRLVYRVTAPCFRGEHCQDCPADPDKKCPEAVSPHAIRRGSITHYLTEDVPVQIVGDRMNVSRDILEKHYDKRTEEIKLEQRRGYLNNI